MTLGRMGGVYALLNAADDVADHWVQTEWQAEHKGDPGATGRRACAEHVAGLVVTRAVFLTAGALLTGERLRPGRVTVGLAVGAGLHYWADRRTPLKNLANRLERFGKPGFYKAGAPRDGHDDPKCLGTGAYILDQAFHHGCRAIEATIIAGKD